MISNVISATQNLTNISGVHQNGKSCFARPVKVTMYKRYFLYSGYLQGEVEVLFLTATQVVVGVVLPLPVQDVDNFICEDFMFHKKEGYHR